MSPEKQTSRDLRIPKAVGATSLILLCFPSSQTLLTLGDPPSGSVNISQVLAQVFCPADSWQRYSCAFRLRSLETSVDVDLLPHAGAEGRLTRPGVN